jgi:hypothetical protein
MNRMGDIDLRVREEISRMGLHGLHENYCCFFSMATIQSYEQ